jgi:hypothetical protein
MVSPEVRQTFIESDFLNDDPVSAPQASVLGLVLYQISFLSPEVFAWI